jgi:DNA-binding SARP family transcriptional activator
LAAGVARPETEANPVDSNADTAPVNPESAAHRFGNLELWHEPGSQSLSLDRLPRVLGGRGGPPIDLELDGLPPGVLTISVQHGRLHFESLQPMLKNGQSSRSGSLEEGDELQLDGHRLRLQSIPLPATLQGCSEPHRGRIWSVGLQALTCLGRAGKRHNDVTLEDPTISRSHATIRRHHQQYTLEVETSGSPTLLNGELLPAGSGASLNDGDLVGLGSSLFRFQLPRLESAPRFQGMRVFSLGTFEVQWEGKTLVGSEWRSHLARYLLAYLALEWPRPVPVESLLEVFWPEMEPDRSRNNLKSTLSSLRAMFKVSDGKNLFERTPQTLQIHPELPVWHDLSELRRSLEQARTAEPAQALRLRRQAVELYRGSYLQDCYLDFAVRTREELNQELVGVGCGLLRHYRQHNQYEVVLDYGRKVLALDSCCQEAYLTMMEACRHLGRPEESIRLYESCKRRLVQEMELEPSLEIERELQRARLNLG